MTWTRSERQPGKKRYVFSRANSRLRAGEKCPCLPWIQIICYSLESDICFCLLQGPQHLACFLIQNLHSGENGCSGVRGKGQQINCLFCMRWSRFHALRYIWSLEQPQEWSMNTKPGVIFEHSWVLPFPPKKGLMMSKAKRITITLGQV